MTWLCNIIRRIALRSSSLVKRHTYPTERTTPKVQSNVRMKPDATLRGNFKNYAGVLNRTFDALRSTGVASHSDITFAQ